MPPVAATTFISPNYPLLGATSGLMTSSMSRAAANHPNQHSFTPGYIQLLQIRDFGERGVPTYVREDSVTKRCTEDDILIARYGASLGRIVTGQTGAYNVALAKVIFDTSKFYNRYLFYLLKTPFFQTPIHMISRSAQNGFNKGDLSDILLPVAPVAEQRRIVAEIEQQFTRLDAGVAALRRTQANLKRYRAAVLKAACEGRLVPTEAEFARETARVLGSIPTGDFDSPSHSSNPQSRKRGSIPRRSNEVQEAVSSGLTSPTTFETGEQLLARILTERRKNWKGRGKYSEPAAPETSKLPSLPEDWTWTSVEQLGEVQLGRQRSPKNISKDYPTKYIRAANITERGIDVSDVLEMEFSPAERERFTLRSGDIVLSEASGSPSQVGKPAMWRDELSMCCFQNTVLRLRPMIVESQYILVVFRHFYANSVFAKVAGGVGINHLGAEKFSIIPFPLPPLAEQTRIVAEVERRLSVIDELEAVGKANLQRATRLRQSVLQQAFAGKSIGESGI